MEGDRPESAESSGSHVLNMFSSGGRRYGMFNVLSYWQPFDQIYSMSVRLTSLIRAIEALKGVESRYPNMGYSLLVESIFETLCFQGTSHVRTQTGLVYCL